MQTMAGAAGAAAAGAITKHGVVRMARQHEVNARGKPLHSEAAHSA